MATKENIGKTGQTKVQKITGKVMRKRSMVTKSTNTMIVTDGGITVDTMTDGEIGLSIIEVVNIGHPKSMQSHQNGDIKSKQNMIIGIDVYLIILKINGIIFLSNFVILWLI